MRNGYREWEEGITFKFGLSKHKSFGILLSQDDSLAVCIKNSGGVLFVDI